MTAEQVADLTAADVDDVRAVVSEIGDLHDDAIPSDWTDMVRAVLDPGGERTRYYAMDLDEELRWAAVDYLDAGDSEALRRISHAGEVKVAHALSMVGVIGGTPAAAEWNEVVDAWFDRYLQRPRFGISPRPPQ